MNRIYCVAALAASFILTGCQSKCESELVDNKIVNVKVKQLVNCSLTLNKRYSGTVEESIGTDLSFSVPGTIKNVYVKTGDFVTKGQIIASIDTTTMNNSYNAAKAALDQAQDAYDRLKLLYEENSLADIKWVDIQSKLQQAQAVEQIAKKNLNDCYLRAPFSGVIAEKKMEIGQNVFPGVPVSKIVTMQQVKVSISVPEGDISEIAVGDKAMLCVFAADDKFIEGNVVEKAVVANPLSRSYEVKIAVDNQKNLLLPGMVTDTYIIGHNDVTGILLPANVIQIDEQNNNFVWVNDGGKASKRIITCREYTAEGVVVDKGLLHGDEVIISGQHKVSEGSVITF